MADIAAVLMGPVIEVAKWVAAPIIRQFNYLCCFTRNITSLKNEEEKLQVAARDLQRKVDIAKDNVRVISVEVESWLKNSDDIKDKMDEILKEVPKVESGCLKLNTRYPLSKRAMETIDRFKELRGQCNFSDDAISQPRPPAAREAIPLERTYEFESRKKIEEDIMATLKVGNVNMMGICGMGGLGKTTMAKRIMKRALEEQVFEEVVMAVVSQPPVNKLKIQVEIGGSLGLSDLKDEISEARVAQKLYARLSGGKRILLVLDDVWEKLVLEDLGIPCGYNGCAILLTSRNRDALSAMNVEKVFGMEVLSKEDAWFLFRERVGTCIDNPKLNSIAKEVIDECQGLPIALTTVGIVLREEMDVSIWKDALRQLRQCDPDIPDLIAKVYNSIRLSYDILGPKHKSIFLLCCLYPEDAHIPLELLTYFCMGLGIFVGGMEEAKNRMCALTKNLKSRSLLLDSKRGDDYVTMHDVIRDVCIFIAKQEGYIGCNDCSWISSSLGIPSSLGFQNLCLIFWICDSVNKEFKVDSSFLEGIRDLYVLYIQNDSFTSLPCTTQSLKNLKTLVIRSCHKLKTLSAVGELVRLEILICYWCISIEELPSEMKELKRLKVLDITGCRNLKRISRGIISSMVGLEELKMLETFKKWEANDREESENAGLRELEALTRLRCLEIEIADRAILVENMRFSSELDKFDIRLQFQSSEFDCDRYDNKLHLYWDKGSVLGDWMQLVRNTECLLLKGSGAHNVDLAKAENIKVLELGECESIKKMVTAASMDDGDAFVLSSMEYLSLFDLPKLEEICDGPVWWLKLKELKLSNLPALKQLWKSSSVHLEKDHLPQLETLTIWRCEKMEQVFKWDGNENNSCHQITKMLFPKLKKVELGNLPNLTSFYHGIQGLEFPQLRELTVESCGKLNCMFSEVNDNYSVGDGRSGVDLEKDYLPHLETLRIVKCEKMEQVFKLDKNENESHQILHITKRFPKLKEVELDDLPNLTSFYHGIQGLEFPQLSDLTVEGCKKLNWMVSEVNDSNSVGDGSSSNTHIHHPSSQPPEVSLRCLKELTTDWTPFVGHIIHVSVFNGLEDLHISGYQGSMSLFSSSIAGALVALVNLRKLNIWWCNEMVKVISDEEEEVVSGGERRVVFPKLQELRLEELPKLVSFCEWKCEVELPLLSKVEILRCPNMKNFSLGPLVTPKLTRVEIEGGADLNDALQQQWRLWEKEQETTDEAASSSGSLTENEEATDTEMDEALSGSLTENEEATDTDDEAAE